LSINPLLTAKQASPKVHFQKLSPRNSRCYPLSILMPLEEHCHNRVMSKETYQAQAIDVCHIAAAQSSYSDGKEWRTTP
jgi:hypothetical protein